MSQMLKFEFMYKCEHQHMIATKVEKSASVTATKINQIQSRRHIAAAVIHHPVLRFRCFCTVWISHLGLHISKGISGADAETGGMGHRDTGARTDILALELVRYMSGSVTNGSTTERSRIGNWTHDVTRDRTLSGANSRRDSAQAAFTDVAMAHFIRGIPFAQSVIHLDHPNVCNRLTPELQVKALGTIFYDVSLSKDITLAAFNGLPGVTISNFQLPGDDPTSGITIETEAVIPSPSQLGIDLGTVGFLAHYGNVEVGPLTRSNLFLAADMSTASALKGRIVRQSGSNMVTIGQLFTQYLQADSIDLVTKGDSVVPTHRFLAERSFRDLVSGFRPRGQKVQSETYAPLVGSNTTLATYQNPFGFSLQVIRSAVDMIIALPDNGTQIATSTLPTSNTVGGVSTGNVADLPISFHNLPLTALSDPAMQVLLEAVTDTPLTNLTFEGSANVTAKATIGNVPIASIPFNVQSSLAGLAGFRTQPVTVADLVAAGGTPDYLLITINTDLLNLSNITLETSSDTFALQFESVTIGSAIIEPLLLCITPLCGSAVTPAEQLLANYVQGVDSETTIQGTLASSPYASLQPALSLITLTPVTIPAIHQLLIPEATLEFTHQHPHAERYGYHQSLTLGSINNVDLPSHPIVAEVHQNIASPVVPFAFTLNSMVIIELILDTAAANDVDLGPLVALFNVALSEPDFVTSITSYVDAGPAVPLCTLLVLSGGSGGTGGDQYIIAPLTTTLQNTSNVSLTTNDIALLVMHQGVKLGRAAIMYVQVHPTCFGSIAKDRLAAVLPYTKKQRRSDLIRVYAGGCQQHHCATILDLRAANDQRPATHHSGREDITLSTSITGLNVPPIIAGVHTHIDLATTLGNGGYIQASFDTFNPLAAPLEITFVQADASFLGTIFAHFDQSFTGLVVPPGQTVNSGIFNGVFLIQGVIASLVIIGENLDIASAATTTAISSVASTTAATVSSSSAAPSSSSSVAPSTSTSASSTSPKAAATSSTTPAVAGPFSSASAASSSSSSSSALHSSASAS
ncbi:hypothetical protein FIBSPDRAFT_1011937 [Athelia psychrophila]|uniref:Uncharacterized protein n=1 Tax=Athelia psychrophila TaxID=1759441 RepID=A0A167UNQ8_9AGAM|nr:hypothetical protein FIBSPDRAFT_1011937 [Fibularhizoctonia sp. CBS 109695]